MKLAIYHPWIYLRSGVERMFAEMVPRSEHDWVLYTHRFTPETTYPELAHLDVRQLTPGVSVQRSAAPIGKAALTIAATKLPRDGARALLVSSEGLGDLVMLRNRIPSVAYCHTPLKIIHDQATNQRLAEMSPKKHAAARVAGPAFTLADRAMWRRYAHAFVNSREVQDRVVAAKLRSRERTEVLYPGVSLDQREFVEGRQTNTFLAAGRIMWQKNLELAIDAIRVAIGRGLDVDLDIAGTVDLKSQSYLAMLRQRAHGLPVRFCVDPTDPQMIGLMQEARALVFTALNEDFGMVLLEAMACGTPVIAVDRGGPTEIVTSSSGWLVEPSAEGFAAALAKAAEPDGFHNLQIAARSRAESFGWHVFTQRVDAVMSAIAQGETVPSRESA